MLFPLLDKLIYVLSENSSTETLQQLNIYRKNIQINWLCKMCGQTLLNECSNSLKGSGIGIGRTYSSQIDETNTPSLILPTAI